MCTEPTGVVDGTSGDHEAHVTTLVRGAPCARWHTAAVTVPPIRTLTPSDLDAAQRVLGRAFADDPIMEFVFRGRPNAAAGIGRLFRLFAGEHVRHDGCSITTDETAIALWAPPGEWKLAWSRQLRMAPSLLRLFGLGSFGHLAGYTRMEQQHDAMPPEHWYLSVIGTDPDHQGKGAGSALITPVIERCDEQGLGAYLESSKAENVPYYRRFGFEVVEEHAFRGGPSYWRMWRDPR